MSRATRDQVMEFVRRASVVRPRDLTAHGLPARHLDRLYRAGLLERVGRGLYEPIDADITEHHMFVEASKRVPHAIICLLSALRFHRLTTQNPFEIWLAVDRKRWLPREPALPLRFVRFSGKALTAGIEYHQLEGMSVPVYNPAKTVADCFKYRNKIGLDVALEALRDTWRRRRATMDELFHYAQICRVANVMRPYLESLV